MNNIRYSQVIGSLFYQIVLVDDDKDMVDTHFTGASHHIKRFHECTNKDDQYFHLSRHRTHLKLMMRIIFERGDFSNAIDKSNRDLNQRETWNPDWTVMPDQNMFRRMVPDWRFEIGQSHASDTYIHADDLIEIESETINQRLAN